LVAAVRVALSDVSAAVACAAVPGAGTASMMGVHAEEPHILRDRIDRADAFQPDVPDHQAAEQLLDLP
jgi:hypothetical protein